MWEPRGIEDKLFCSQQQQGTLANQRVLTKFFQRVNPPPPQGEILPFMGCWNPPEISTLHLPLTNLRMLSQYSGVLLSSKTVYVSIYMCLFKNAFIQRLIGFDCRTRV